MDKQGSILFMIFIDKENLAFTHDWWEVGIGSAEQEEQFHKRPSSGTKNELSNLVMTVINIGNFILLAIVIY